MLSKMKIFQLIRPHLIALGIFLLITLAYFYPVIEGKDVRQMDMTHATGMARELVVHHKTTGEYSQWTNSMFGGMPAYHVGPLTKDYSIFGHITRVIKLNLSNNSAGIVFVMMICFYILLTVLGINTWLAIAGAIAFALSTYNPIIIGAGHVTKAWAIAFMPLIIAGVIKAYRGKYVLGGILAMLGLGLSISSNHFQITYYTGLIVLVFAIGFFADALREKKLRNFWYASLVLVVAALLAILPNSYTIYTNYELGKTSIRSSSELEEKANDQKSSGLDIDYAFTWSYGKTESLSLLVPNLMGGSSNAELSTNSHLYKELRDKRVADPEQYIKQVPAYWGDMPFTSGPAYHGAVIVFLFVLGLFIVKNSIRWYLLAATILSLFLAWGYHFKWFNEIMFYYFPLYNKFRTVSMSMVIAQFTMPFLGILALWEILKNPNDKKELLKGLKWSTIITGGLTLIIILFGSALFNFRAASDIQLISQVPDWFYNALLADRKKLMTSDAFRSLVFIVLSAGVLWVVIKQAKYLKYIAPAFLILILADLWPVAKRYLDQDDFVAKSKKYDFQPSLADNFILQDASLSHRVLNLNNPFNEVNTSYFHKSIGGYHGAKQRRYQDLIENQLQSEITAIISVLSKSPVQESIDSVLQSSQVLNMLNTKYIIYNPAAQPLLNDYHNGNAWFVNEYHFVENADEEMEALGDINTRETVLIDEQFSTYLEGFKIDQDTTGYIELQSYLPNKLVYSYSVEKPQLTVFSEVFYPYGWKASIDGEPVDHIRVNWFLRAMILPEGQHELTFTFEPDEFYFSQKLSLWSSIFIGLVLMGVIVMVLRRKVVVG
jgi:hypothetical protein